MNYREFTERVYNYKHGLTNSAESQNIEHSAKQTEEINENEHIEHSGQGQTWDQHKYIRKEYLGNGNWRYIYEDGSSNVTNAANEKEADVKEGAYQMNKAYGNGAQNTNYQTSAGSKMSSNTDFTQARKDMYKELGEKAADHNKQLENFQGMAKGLEQSNADQEASKLKIQAGNIANNLGASQKETEDRKMYVDLENKARDYNKQLEGFQGVTKSLEQSNADQAESARQLEKEALASKAQARSDRFDKMANLDVNTSATPLNQLQNQGTTASQNAQAQTILTNYEDTIVTDVLEPLRALGIPDEAIWASIEKVENEVAGEAITNSLRDVGSAKQVLFFPGAEEGLKVYRDQVMPALKDMVAVEKLTRKDNKVNDIVSSLDDEEKELLMNALTKKNSKTVTEKPTVNDNVTTWENVPTQTFDNIASQIWQGNTDEDKDYARFNENLLKNNDMTKPDSNYTYVIEKGYDPNHIPVDAVKELFNYENTKYDDIYEYSIDSLGNLHYKRRSWNEQS